jgi:hypothetical protein
MVLALCASFLTSLATAQSSLTNTYSSVARELLREQLDLRVLFYGDVSERMRQCITNGHVLVVQGRLNKTEFISTNLCPTIGKALAHLGYTRLPSQPRLRVVKMNMIMQCAWAEDGDPKSDTVMKIRLDPGDVLIFCPLQ